MTSLAACGSSGQQENSGAGLAATRPIRIVATIAPLADLAKRVGGARCEVITLVPPGASAHTWEPSPRDVERFRDADLMFEVGFGYEFWLEKLVSGGDLRFEVIDASEGVEPILDGDGESPDPGAGSLKAPAVPPGQRHTPADPPQRPNPHYWLDPIALKGSISLLAEALARRDPAGAEGYGARAAHVGAALDALDAEIRVQTGRWNSRKLVTFHAAWEYMARRYGLTVLAAIEPSPGKEPGPRHIERIVKLVRENSLRAVFAEPQFPAKAAEAIATECGVRVLTLDPIGGEGVPGRGDYFAMMRYNVGVMEEALR